MKRVYSVEYSHLLGILIDKRWTNTPSPIKNGVVLYRDKDVYTVVIAVYEGNEAVLKDVVRVKFGFDEDGVRVKETVIHPSENYEVVLSDKIEIYEVNKNGFKNCNKRI